MLEYKQPALPLHITVGAFFDRFGDQKIPVLASADPTIQALVKDALSRRFIDLTNSDLPLALDAIIALNFPIDKVAILTTPINDNERP